jgi:hypothetical protein
MDHDLFDPPSSVDAALEEIERLKVLLKAINDELGNKIIRESMPPRDYRPWRAEKMNEQSRASQRYRYVNKWINLQKMAVRKATQRAQGLDVNDPINLLTAARWLIIDIHSEHDISFSHRTEILLNAITDYVDGRANEAMKQSIERKNS